MKQMRKRSLIFVLAFALLVGNICITPKEAKAATQSDAVAWANAQLGKGVDYDGVYGNQCVDLIKYYYAYFGVANYAMGNANAYISNSLPPGWTRVYSNYQPGDIAVWKVNHSCSTCNTGGYGHVGIITSADSTGFNAVNQNFCSKSYCTQNWFYCSALACAIRPSFTNSTNVTFSDFHQNNVWDNNAEFYVKATKSGAGNITNVGCYLYDANGSLLKSYKENCNYANYCNYTCNMVNDMGYSLSPGTTYKIVLFAIANGKEFKDSMRTFKTTGYSDTTKPVVSDVSVKDVSENGYTIRCKATDNIGVDRVQFPTWTILNGQDDIQNDWGTNILARGTAVGNNYYEYRVNVSAHNNELGAYATHIYAYDKVGNYTCVVVPTTTLTKPTPIPTPNYQEVDGSRLASVAEKEYDTYHGQSYNYQYGTSPWCCNFVSWCARQAGISTDVMKSTATVQTMYDNLLNECGARVVSSPQRGDLVFYKYTDYDSQKFHHIGIMTSATETVQGNVNNTWWKGKPDALNNIKEMVYVRPAYDGKYVAPSTAYFNDYNLNKVTDDNAELYIKIQNPNREGVTSVGCELYTEDGVLLKSYSENCNWCTSYVNYTCNFQSDMGYTLSSGTTYKFVLYAIVGGNRINDTMKSFTTVGNKEEEMEQETEEDISETEDESAEQSLQEEQTGSNGSPKTNVKKVSLKKPPKVKGLSLKTTSKKIFADWRFDTSVNRTGYQVQYAMNKSFTKSKKTKTVGYYTTDVTLKKLKKKKTYYVRVRGINRVGNVTKYGTWSTVKKIKVR